MKKRLFITLQTTRCVLTQFGPLCIYVLYSLHYVSYFTYSTFSFNSPSLLHRRLRVLGPLEEESTQYRSTAREAGTRAGDNSPPHQNR